MKKCTHIASRNEGFEIKYKQLGLRKKHYRVRCYYRVELRVLLGVTPVGSGRYEFSRLLFPSGWNWMWNSHPSNWWALRNFNQSIKSIRGFTVHTCYHSAGQLLPSVNGEFFSIIRIFNVEFSHPITRSCLYRRFTNRIFKICEWKPDNFYKWKYQINKTEKKKKKLLTHECILHRCGERRQLHRMKWSSRGSYSYVVSELFVFRRIVISFFSRQIETFAIAIVSGEENLNWRVI